MAERSWTWNFHSLWLYTAVYMNIPWRKRALPSPWVNWNMAGVDLSNVNLGVPKPLQMLMGTGAENAENSLGLLIKELRKM